MPTILFRRDYRRFYGGHLKVYDYYKHARSADGFTPKIYLTPETIADNLWGDDVGLVDKFDPRSADVLFLAGNDWTALDEYPGIEDEKPVINLIQGFRHLDPATPLYDFLGRRAIRICVSDELAKALQATGVSNGSILTINNGIDLSLLDGFRPSKETDVFIVGLKQKRIANCVAKILSDFGLNVDLVIEHVPRAQFLARMAR